MVEKLKGYLDDNKSTFCITCNFKLIFNEFTAKIREERGYRSFNYL